MTENNQFKTTEPQHDENDDTLIDTANDDDATVLENNNVDLKLNKKTPMCYINELAKYNKLHPQYILQNEIGPAHKKTFYVTLKLFDNEEYTALGTSIKKAQQAAAQMALDNTKFPKPIKNHCDEQRQLNDKDRKKQRNSSHVNGNRQQQDKTFTPTVRLNAMAMKLGYEPKYRFLNSYSNNYNNNNTRRLYNPYMPATVSTRLTNGYMNGYTNFNPTNIPQPNTFVYSDFNMKMGRLDVDNNKNLVTHNGSNPDLINKPPIQESFALPLPPPPPLLEVQETFTCVLQVASQTFQGVGTTRQLAKHDAASKALHYYNKFRSQHQQLQQQDQRGSRVRKRQQQQLKSESMPNEPNSEDTNETAINKNSIKPLVKNKSEITLIQEVAYCRKTTIKYDLVQESGPSHIKKYVTQCQFEQYETLGEGKSKKESKRDASLKMLEKLDELKVIDLKQVKSASATQVTTLQTPTDESVLKSVVNDTENGKTEPPTNGQALANKRQKSKKNHKRKPKNIVQANKVNPDYGLGSINPISRLMQIQQAKKEPEPVYELLDEKVKFRKHEFTIQVRLGVGDSSMTCTGVGNSKRVAKQNAAENMLSSMGYSKPQPPPSQQPKPVLKSSSGSTMSKDEQTAMNNNNDSSSKNFNVSEKKVKFIGIAETETVRKASETNGTPQVIVQQQQLKFQQNRNLTLSSQFNRLAFNNRHHRTLAQTQAQAQLQQQQQTVKLANEVAPVVPAPPDFHQQKYKETLQITSKISNELLNNGHSETGEAIKVQKQQLNTTIDSNTAAPVNNKSGIMLNENSDYKEKLLYLAELMDFQVNFHSLSKKDEGISSYVNISMLQQTEKPFNGNGKTSVESCNTAALSALKYLSELSVQSPKSPSPPPPQPTQTTSNLSIDESTASQSQADLNQVNVAVVSQ